MARHYLNEACEVRPETYATALALPSAILSHLQDFAGRGMLGNVDLLIITEFGRKEFVIVRAQHSRANKAIWGWAKWEAGHTYGT